MSGVAITRSKSILPAWTCVDEVFGTDDVGTGLAGFLGLGVLGEHGDADRLAGAVGQVHHAADHLVGVTRIDAQVHRDLDGLVELGLGARTHHRDGFAESVELLAIDAFADGGLIRLPSCAIA